MKRSLLVALVFCLGSTFGAAQAPSNDECSGAVPVTLGTNPAPAASGNFYSNVGATTSAGYPAICASLNSDVWFSFTPATTDVYQIDTSTPAGFTAGTETDTVLAVYDSCIPGAPLACDDDTGTGNLSQLSVALAAGQTYLIRVGDWSTSVNPGTFYLNINPDPLTMGLVFSSPSGTSCLQIDILNGPANGAYYLAATLNPGAYPNGYFFGVDIFLQEIADQIQAGAPFVGGLDSTGHAQIGEFCGLPSGLTFYAVALGFAANGLSIPTEVSNTVQFTIP
jgi:hypothetical protein